MQKKDGKVRTMTFPGKCLYFALTILVPVVLLVCLEFSLRMFGYGIDLSLFRQQRIHGSTYYVLNPEVKYRYFGSMPFAPSTSVYYFTVPKPKEVFRIFCLGGSTTAGYPYYFNASFPSLLGERLAFLFPKKKIEVINLGMTATNSYTTLDIARELAECQPDLVIVYDGHNEFYGALGVSSNHTSGSFRFLTLLYLKLIHLRTFQLIQNSIHAIAAMFRSEQAQDSERTVMEDMSYGQYIKSGDARYNAAYRIFRENLGDLRDYCRSNGIPLLLGTQVSSLRDQPPFISGNSDELNQVQRTKYRTIYKRGLEFQSGKMSDSAITYFRSAVAMDSLYAGSHYHLAQCLDYKGKRKEALRQYILARDYDELRFRTDSRFNDLIRSMDDGKYCHVADIESEFKSVTPDSLVGFNLITEHLHPNVRGNFIIAESFARVMRRYGILATQQEWKAADAADENMLWNKRNVTDLDEKMAAQAVRFMTSRWPFSSRPKPAVSIGSGDTISRIAGEMAKGECGWLDGHRRAAAFYLERGETADAEKEYITIISMYPHIIEYYLDLAKIYFRERRFEEMKNILLRSLQVQPTLPAYYALGNIMMDRGDPEGALPYFEKTDQFAQSTEEKINNGFAISRAYAGAGKYFRARARLLRLLELKPDFEPAKKLLADVNKKIEAIGKGGDR